MEENQSTRAVLSIFSDWKFKQVYMLGKLLQFPLDEAR